MMSGKMKKSLLLSFVAILMFASVAFAADYSSRTVTFNGYSNNHTYTSANFVSDYGNTDYYVVNQATISNGQLKLKLPANEENVGLKARITVPQKASYYAEIKFRVPSGFPFGNANDMKIPLGFGGGTNPVGGNPDPDNGWSVRLFKNTDGKLGLYAYHANQSSIWGDKWMTDVTFQANTWYTARLWMKVNNSNTNNGEVKLWINGTQKINKTGIRWSNNNKNITKIHSDLFRGGAGDPPGSDAYFYIDEFKWWY